MKNIISITTTELANRCLNIKPQAFANEVLLWCRVFGFKDITNLKFQKLIYYCYVIVAWNLEKIPFLPIEKTKNNNDVTNLDFLPLGPVILPVYEELKHFGSAILAKNYDEYENAFLKYFDENDTSYEPKFEKYQMDTEYQKEIETSIKYTLIALGDLSAGQLVNKTHADFSAWNVFCEKKSSQKTNSNILDKILKEVYRYGFFDKEYDEKEHKYS